MGWVLHKRYSLLRKRLITYYFVLWKGNHDIKPIARKQNLKFPTSPKAASHAFKSSKDSVFPGW